MQCLTLLPGFKGRALVTKDMFYCIALLPSECKVVDINVLGHPNLILEDEGFLSDKRLEEQLQVLNSDFS